MFTDVFCFPAEDLFGGRIELRHAPLGVRHQYRIIQRIDRRLGRLLRDDEPTQVGAPQLANPLGHAVKFGGQKTDLIMRSDRRLRVVVAAGDLRRRRPQLAQGPDDPVGKEKGKSGSGQRQRDGDQNRQREPMPGRARGPF